ncbi:hypothetical protein L226DRAFT_470128, partial [Lentinus tigrinus ALCF2SS1-7]
VTGILYPLATRNPRNIPLPIFIDHDDDPRSRHLLDDVRVAHWFPHGTIYTRIHTVPGTALVLRNDYTIITSADSARAPVNKAIELHFGITFRGNIIVLRHGYRNSMAATNVHSSERGFIDFTVRQ